VFEATGTYGERLALHLHAAGHMVSVINPAAIKAYAGAQLSRTKTDRVDAELIARFARRSNPSAGHRQRRKYTSCKHLCAASKCAQQNRTGSKRHLARIRSCAAHSKNILLISTRRSSALSSLFARINNHSGLKEQSALLDSIPGITDDCCHAVG
jgi:transposase